MTDPSRWVMRRRSLPKSEDDKLTYGCWKATGKVVEADGVRCRELARDVRRLRFISGVKFTDDYREIAFRPINTRENA